MKSLVLIVMFIGVIGLVGCSANASDGDPGHVKIISRGLPSGCHFRGSVHAMRGDINGGPARGITQEQMEELSSQAAALGANLVLLTGQSAHYYDEYIVSNAQVHSELEAQVVQGRAYSCPGRRR